jgi:hypothetical protein
MSKKGLYVERVPIYRPVSVWIQEKKFMSPYRPKVKKSEGLRFLNSDFLVPGV